MNSEESRAVCLDAAYLAACAAEDRTPDPARAKAMDTEALLSLAKRHSLTCILASALESGGVTNEEFSKESAKAIRKAVLLRTEREAVFAALESAYIRYMPLKGAVLESMYPSVGMRQMSDVDVLIEKDRAEEVRRIMEGLGYACTVYARGAHDRYEKPPVYGFEMHRTLFPPEKSVLYDHYADVWDKLLPDGEKGCRFRFSDDDFYVYLLAHAYKHHTIGGTGLRSLLDIWIYLRRRATPPDRDYIGKELEKLGIADFEAAFSGLACRLFGEEALTEEDLSLLDYVCSSGTYGTVEHRAERGIAKRGRLGYLVSRVFPSRRAMLLNYQILKPLPFLLPVCWALRLAFALVTKPRKALVQARTALRRKR